MPYKFPVIMTHPGFQPAVISTSLEKHGRPVRFPPVVLNTDNDVEYYLAQGYAVTDKIDPRYFEPTSVDAPAYVNVRYPSWEHGTLVKDEAQHRALFPHDFKVEQAAPLETPVMGTVVVSQSALLEATGATVESWEEVEKDDAAQNPPPHELRFG